MAKRGNKQRGATNLPVPNPERAASMVDLQGRTKQDVVKILRGYWAEAQQNRIGGPSSRELMWQQNVDLYWNRFDFSKKAQWQAHEVMPEFPQIVDRFAANMRDALTSTDDWFVVEAPYDAEQDLGDAIRKLMRLWLSRCSRDPLGHPVSFDAVFEDQMKLGALMTCAAVVTQKGQGPNSYTCIEAYDPRNVWLDTTGRNLYRVRRYQIDQTQLMQMARLEDNRGAPLYDMDELQQLAAEVALKQAAERERLTGTGQQETSTRHSVIIDEYLCTLIDSDGTLLAENVLCVVANEMFLIRGPEPNPFWHQEDWLLSAPLVTAPLSAYGRSFMENAGTIARTFNELTNLILDGTFTTAMKAFAANPEALRDPTQLAEGVWPNKVFQLEDGVDPKLFMSELDLGQLPPEAISVWQALRAELKEAGLSNDLMTGQFAPKGRTSSTEIQSVQNNATAPLRALAKSIEQRFLEPLLSIFWRTGVQHMQKRDKVAERLIGPTMYAAIYARRRELCAAPITFRVRAISALITRMQRLQSLLNLLQVVAQNQLLMQQFLQKVDPGRLVDLLFRYFDVDVAELQPTARDQLIAALTQQQPGPGPGAPPGPGPGAPPGSMAPLPTPNPVGIGPRATPISNAAPIPAR